MTPRFVLGLSASHNGAACVLRDGIPVVAVQEERLTRVKRAHLSPGNHSQAITACLAAAGISPRDLATIAIAPLPDTTSPGVLPDPAGPLGLVPCVTISHHLAHAASVLAWSGWRDATILVADGFGSTWLALSDDERAAVVNAPAIAADPTRVWRETMSIYAARDGQLVALEKHMAPVATPHGLQTPLGPFGSAGQMYQAVARYLFGSWDAAGKVMGLAPFGDPARFGVELFWSRTGNHFIFNDSAHGIGGLLGRLPPERRPVAGRPGVERDPIATALAASVQRALERLVDAWVQRSAELAANTQGQGTQGSRLGLAGGVFLNAVANQQLIASQVFDQVFIVPAAEDSGTALGAAWLASGSPANAAIAFDALGPAYGPETIDAAVTAFAETSAAISVRVQRPDKAALVDLVARDLAAGLVVAHFDGRSELGPRALGQRSILFDPRRADARDRLNFNVKRREGFRPFAPAVLAEVAADWFDFGNTPADSPWMLRVCPVRPERRAEVPGIVHVDGSARIQTVAPAHERLDAIIRAFAAITGVPLLINTSFNVADEPLVESPGDALRCFTATAIDTLVLGHVVLQKL